MSKIGIVTVLYNSEKVLDDFFRTLNAQTFKDFTLYVIDNASTDNGLEVARTLAETVSFKTVFFPEPENWGVAKGNNIGIRAALSDGCEFILLSNNDTVLNPDTIQMLMSGMAEMGTTMSVPKIYYHDTGLIWYAGGRIDYFRGGTIHDGQLKADSEAFSSRSLTEYAPTCFMLIQRNVFDRVGLMDEDYFVYYDDTDFVWRATKSGNEKIAYIPSSQLWHKESYCTKSVGNDFKLFYSGRNFRYFILKNYKGFRKFSSLAYSILHTFFVKNITYNRHQMEVYKKGIAEGKNLAKSKLINK